tara:strand:- start:50 stop:307 length:258 start_codon:yes stop_codon:yes gene_type:complete
MPDLYRLNRAVNSKGRAKLLNDILKGFRCARLGARITHPIERAFVYEFPEPRGHRSSLRYLKNQYISIIYIHLITSYLKHLIAPK